MKSYLFIVLLLLSASSVLAQNVETENTRLPESKIDSLKTLDIVKDFWNEFKEAVIKKDINYLIENSQDSIECATCFFKEGMDAKWVPSEYIFENHLEEFYDSAFFQNLQATFHPNEEQYMINYSIKDETAPEGGYNIIYALLFTDGEYKLLAVYPIP